MATEDPGNTDGETTSHPDVEYPEPEPEAEVIVSDLGEAAEDIGEALL